MLRVCGYAAHGRPGRVCLKARESIQSFLTFIERTRGVLTHEQNVSLDLWAEHFLQETKYLEELRRSEKDLEAGENRVRNLKDLILTMGADEEARRLAPAERLQHFLEELMLDTDREEEEEEKERNAVTLITMHSCKGLEFPRVYVAGVEDGLLPHTRSKEENNQDEERRLFYVAMTRAQETLSLSYCLSRKKYGSPVPCHPSPFLKELPGELVEDAAEKSKQPVAPNAGKDFFAVMRAAVE